MNVSGDLYSKQSYHMRHSGTLNCPAEAEILSYSENRLRGRRRSRLEKHLAGCEDCRETMILLTQGELVSDIEPLNESADQLRVRAVGVLEMIARDERERASDWFSRFRIPAMATASAVLLLLVAGVTGLFNTGQSPTDSAMDALAQAIKADGRRRTPVRLSGDLPYHQHRIERGGGKPTGSIQFDQALSRIRHAESEIGGTPAVRLVQARIYLALADAVSLQKAIGILEELVDSGEGSAEVVNDLGVARFQKQEYGASIEAFSRALALSPDMEEALFNRALAKRQLSFEAGVEPEAKDQLRREARADYERFMTLASDPDWKEEANRLIGDVAVESLR